MAIKDSRTSRQTRSASSVGSTVIEQPVGVDLVGGVGIAVTGAAVSVPQLQRELRALSPTRS